MDFSRAKKGTKLVMIGEILLIAALAVSIVAGALMMAAGASEQLQNIGVFMFMGSGGIAFVAQILVIIGLFIAAKFAHEFIVSMILSIVSVLCDSANGFLQSVGFLPAVIASMLSSLVFAFAVFFGLKGIATLGEKSGNAELPEKSKKMIIPVFVVTALSMIFGACSVFVTDDMLSGVMSLLATSMSVVVVILYITVLKKTKEL